MFIFCDSLSLIQSLFEVFFLPRLYLLSCLLTCCFIRCRFFPPYVGGESKACFSHPKPFRKSSWKLMWLWNMCDWPETNSVWIKSVIHMFFLVAHLNYDIDSSIFLSQVSSVYLHFECPHTSKISQCDNDKDEKISSTIWQLLKCKWHRTSLRRDSHLFYLFIVWNVIGRQWQDILTSIFFYLNPHF